MLYFHTTPFWHQDKWFFGCQLISHLLRFARVALKNNSHKNLQVEHFLTSHCWAVAELQDRRGLSVCVCVGGRERRTGDWKSYGNVKQRIVILDSPVLLPRASCAGPNERVKEKQRG